MEHDDDERTDRAPRSNRVSVHVWSFRSERRAARVRRGSCPLRCPVSDRRRLRALTRRLTASAPRAPVAPSSSAHGAAPVTRATPAHGPKGARGSCPPNPVARWSRTQRPTVAKASPVAPGRCSTSFRGAHPGWVRGAPRLALAPAIDWCCAGLAPEELAIHRRLAPDGSPGAATRSGASAGAVCVFPLQADPRAGA